MLGGLKNQRKAGQKTDYRAVTDCRNQIFTVCVRIWSSNHGPLNYHYPLTSLPNNPWGLNSRMIIIISIIIA